MAMFKIASKVRKNQRVPGSYDLRNHLLRNLDSLDISFDVLFKAIRYSQGMDGKWMAKGWQWGLLGGFFNSYYGSFPNSLRLAPEYLQDSYLDLLGFLYLQIFRICCGFTFRYNYPYAGAIPALW